MFKSLLALSLGLSAVATAASGNGTYGIGINLGQSSTGSGSDGKSSSGFNGLNFRMGQDESLDFIAAWNPGAIIINGNYLHHGSPVLREIPIKAIVPYAGIGIGLWMNDNSGAWAQVPLGIDFRFKVPVEAGLYIAPGMDLVPSTQLTIHYGIGVRYWL